MAKRKGFSIVQDEGKFLVVDNGDSAVAECDTREKALRELRGWQEFEQCRRFFVLEFTPVVRRARVKFPHLTEQEIECCVDNAAQELQKSEKAVESETPGAGGIGERA